MAENEEPMSFDDDDFDNLIDEHNNAQVDNNNLVLDEDVDEGNVENNTVPKVRDDDDDDLASGNSTKSHLLSKKDTHLL